MQWLSRFALSAALVLSGCTLQEQPPRRQVPDGDPKTGRAALLRYGCGGCHVIPGIHEAAGRVAQPLNAFSQRAFIAGVLSNSPENLIRWIQNPRQVNPGTAMPNLGVSEREARDMAAYLYSVGDD